MLQYTVEIFCSIDFTALNDLTGLTFIKEINQVQGKKEITNLS